jgi:hypothetical protein
VRCLAVFRGFVFLNCTEFKFLISRNVPDLNTDSSYCEILEATQGPDVTTNWKDAEFKYTNVGQGFQLQDRSQEVFNISLTGGRASLFCSSISKADGSQRHKAKQMEADGKQEVLLQGTPGS